MKEHISVLTKRETEIINLTFKGLKNSMIANELFISVKTVETHKNNVVKKLHLNSTIELYGYIFKNSDILEQ